MSVTNLMIIVTAGVLAFIANNGVTKDKWPLAGFLVVIGVCGVLFTIKLDEIMQYHMRVARDHRKELETFVGFDSTALRDEIERTQKELHPYIFRKKFLLLYWIILHSLIGFLGLFLAVYVLSR